MNVLSKNCADIFIVEPEILSNGIELLRPIT